MRFWQSLNPCEPIDTTPGDSPVRFRNPRHLEKQPDGIEVIPVGIPAGYELTGNGHLFEQLHGKNPYIQLDKLVEQGLGTLDYELETVE